MKRVSVFSFKLRVSGSLCQALFRRLGLPKTVLTKGQGDMEL